MSDSIKNTDDLIREIISRDRGDPFDDVEKRMWLRTIIVLLRHLEKMRTDGSDKVQKVQERLYLVASERAIRILRGDIVD